MNKIREELLKRAVEIVKKQDDHDTEVSKLFAHALQAGYELGKLVKEEPAS